METVETTVRRGEIHWIEKAQSTYGSETQKSRPALVVSNNMQNSTSEIIQVVYLTSQPKKDLPTHVTVHSTSNGKAEGSTILCENVFSISKLRLQENSYHTRLSDADMEKVDKALRIGLALDAEPTQVPTDAEETETQELAQAKMEIQFYKDRYNEILERIMRRAAI